MMHEPVYVVDDDEIVLLSVKAILTQHGYSVQCFSSAAEFLQSAALDGPGCVVTDLQMPEMTGVELQQHLVEEHSPLAVVVVTGVADVPTAISLMERGAITLLEKPYDPSALLRAVKRGLETSQANWRQRMAAQEMEQQLGTLTEEEREVLQHLLEGKSNKEVANTLHLSLRTMDRRRRAVLDKMHSESIPELALKLGSTPQQVLQKAGL
jgi:FixJ family two-component response regulator